jgi:hypothetical protein
MDTQFNIVLENLMERYQQGGFMIGDRVRYREDCLKLDFFKHKASNFIEMVSACMDPKFDLNIRVSAIKSIYPTTTQNYRGGTEAPDNIYVDVIIEYAPGLYRNPMTVPIEALEIQDDGFDRGPVPNSVKYDNKVSDKPEKIKTKQNNKFKADVNLGNVNVKISGGSKWKNTPGGGSEWKDLPKNKRVK